MAHIYRLYSEDQEDGFWLVRCGDGRGRVGRILAYLLAMYRTDCDSAEDKTPKMSSSEAIALVRHLRPGGIDVPRQEDFVQAWLSHC